MKLIEKNNMKKILKLITFFYFINKVILFAILFDIVAPPELIV